MVGFQANGRPRVKSVYGRTQKEAREKLEAFKQKLAGNLNWEADYTFDAWSDIWLGNHKSEISSSTFEHYTYILRTLKKSLGSRHLENIRAYDIEQLLRDLRREGRSDSYLSSARGLLYMIFNKAEANELIPKNPVRFAEKIRHSREMPKRKEAFTAEEVRLLMAQLPLDRIGLSIRLMLGTGMRTQELLALEPRHIAEDGSMICIRQAVVRVTGGTEIGPPKSRDSYRDIPVPPSLKSCAVALRETPDKFILEAGIPGKPCSPSCFRKKFKDAIKKIEGVRVLTPHCCRHTYVSQMQALGVDLSTIQGLVGHAQINMTEHYLHVQDSVREDAIHRFDNAFGHTGVDELHGT